MGTRSNTIVKESKNGSKTICNIYRQFDGSPFGHGAELKEKFGAVTIINGFSGHKAPKFANGVSCFAAQLVAALKDGIGNIYLFPIEDNDSIGENDYTYILYPEKDSFKTDTKLLVDVYEFGNLIYSGLLSEMPTN